MNSKVVPLLIVLLVIASFLAGSFWTRTRYLEGEQAAVQPTPSPAVIAEEEPAPAVLGAEARTEIEEEALAAKGEEDATVTIVEFSEYLCPFCAEYVGSDAIPERPIDEEKTYQQILDNYVETGQARYLFRDFPVHGEPAMKIAEAAYCAGDQDKYWEYHDLLFENQTKLYEAEDLETVLKELALESNLDEDTFASCLAESQFAQVVQDNYELAQKVGVQGTPSFFINGTLLVGAQPFENFQAVIEEALSQD
jgi:protein-disulfide isomerase